MTVGVYHGVITFCHYMMSEGNSLSNHISVIASKRGLGYFLFLLYISWIDMTNNLCSSF